MAKRRSDDRSNDPKRKTPPPLVPSDDAGVDDVGEVIELHDDELVADAPFFVDDVPAKPETPAPIKAREVDSVFEDEMVPLSTGLDSAQHSGVFSSVIRSEPESAVNPISEVIRGEPLSESAMLDPISEIARARADSDVRAENLAPMAEPMLGADDVTDLNADAVMDADIVADDAVVAMPESEVREETQGMEDAIGAEQLPSVTDSSVSLKSFRGQSSSFEKEPIVDLEETLPASDLPRANPMSALDDADSADAVVADDIDIDALVSAEDSADESDEVSEVNLGQKPRKGSGRSGIDPLAEALESGVRLDSNDEMPVVAAKAASVAGPPSVEFDDLVVEDDEVAAVDLGADEPVKPKKASAKLPRPKVEDVTDADDVMDIEDISEGEPATIQAVPSMDEDDVAAMLMDDVADVTDAAPVDVDEPVSEMVAVAEDSEEVAAVVDDEEEPVTRPAPRGKSASGRTPVDHDMPTPYQEPKRGGGWGSLMGGTLLGVFLTAGAGAGVYFGAPDLIAEGLKGLGSEKIPTKSPLVQARESISDGNYEQAVNLLAAVPDTEKSQVGARGEARWLAYMKAKLDDKSPLSKDDAEVKQALDDLKKADSTVLLDQVRAVLESETLKSEVDKLKKSEEMLKEEAKKAAEEKEKTDTLVAGIAKTLSVDKLELAAFEKIHKELTDNSSTLTKINVLLKDAKVDDAGDKGVDKLLAAKKDADDKVAAVDKLLEGEKVGPGAKGLQEVLTNRDKLAKDRDDLDQTLKTAFQELLDGKLAPDGGDPRKGIVAATKNARQKAESPLGGPLTSLAGAMSQMSFGVGDLVKDAFEVASLHTENQFFRAREMLIPSPEEQLDRLVAALHNRNEKSKKLIAEAGRLSAYVLSDESKASESAKAKALYVQGLAERNLANFETARQKLKGAVDAMKNSSAAWAVAARRAASELSDPSAYYLPRVEKLQGEDNIPAALKEVEDALKAVGPDNALLLAQRGLLQLQKSRGKVDPAAAAQIKNDASIAAGDPKTAAVGNYVLGKVEESQGNFKNAEKFYRDAIKAGQDDEQLAKVRLALGRLLLRDHGAGAFVPPAPALEPEPEPKKDLVDPKKEIEPKKKDDLDLKKEPVHPEVDPKKNAVELKKKDEPEKEAAPDLDQKKVPADLKNVDPDKKGVLDPMKEEAGPDLGLKTEPDAKNEEPKKAAPEDKVSQAFPLVAVLVIGQVPEPLDEDDPETQARITETIGIAQKLISSKDKKIRAQGYMLLGEAYSRQGRRTEGLKQYAKGLELLYPEAQVQRLIDEHPAFSVPDGLQRANPLLAEKHYGLGLHLFYGRKFQEAEDQFRQAIAYFDKDARYFYFMGLSQLEQKTKIKRDAAYFAWEQASRLEANARPNTAEINFALERIQGDRRTMLNSIRNKASIGP